jgi:hypothetical protein
MCTATTTHIITDVLDAQVQLHLRTYPRKQAAVKHEWLMRCFASSSLLSEKPWRPSAVADISPLP